MATRSRDYDWNLLKTFHAVAEAGSVSGAARSLGREQPSVSAALKRLEGHFGAVLCERGARGITLTPSGRKVLEATADCKTRLESLAEDVAATAGTGPEALRLRMISDVVAPHLDRALAAFHARHPRVDLTIDIAPWRQVIDGVRRADAMLGITCDSMPSDALVYRPLIEEVQQLYCGPSHRLFREGPFEPEALVGEAFVLTGEDEPDELTVFRARYGLGRKAGGHAETLNEARKLIAMGFGIGFLPTAVAAEAGMALWPLLSPKPLPRYPVYLVTRPDGLNAPPVQRLLTAFLSEIEGGHP